MIGKMTRTRILACGLSRGTIEMRVEKALDDSRYMDDGGTKGVATLRDNDPPLGC